MTVNEYLDLYLDTEFPNRKEISQWEFGKYAAAAINYNLANKEERERMVAELKGVNDG